MSHVKSHYRFVNGKSVYIADHDDARPQGRPAELHERTAIGRSKSGTHYLRATDAEDGKQIEEAAGRLGIQVTKKRAGANHHGRVGAYSHYHVEEPEHAAALHEELKKQSGQGAPQMHEPEASPVGAAEQATEKAHKLRTPEAFREAAGAHMTASDHPGADRGMHSRMADQHFDDARKAERETATPDEQNPKYALQTHDTKHLQEAAAGTRDLNKHAKAELVSRGLDSNGKWIGFDAAKTHHGVESMGGDDEGHGHFQTMHNKVLGAAARGELDLNASAKKELENRGVRPAPTAAPVSNGERSQEPEGQRRAAVANRRPQHPAVTADAATQKANIASASGDHAKAAEAHAAAKDAHFKAAAAYKKTGDSTREQKHLNAGVEHHNMAAFHINKGRERAAHAPEATPVKAEGASQAPTEAPKHLHRAYGQEVPHGDPYNSGTAVHKVKKPFLVGATTENPRHQAVAGAWSPAQNLHHKIATQPGDEIHRTSSGETFLVPKGEKHGTKVELADKDEFGDERGTMGVSQNNHVRRINDSEHIEHTHVLPHSNREYTYSNGHTDPARVHALKARQTPTR